MHNHKSFKYILRILLNHARVKYKEKNLQT